MSDGPRKGVYIKGLGLSCSFGATELAVSVLTDSSAGPFTCLHSASHAEPLFCLSPSPSLRLWVRVAAAGGADDRAMGWGEMKGRPEGWLTAIAICLSYDQEK